MEKDNGFKKHFTIQTIIGITILIGIIVTLVANIRDVPKLEKITNENSSRLDILETKFEFILSGIEEIKNLIKEK